MTKSDLIKTLKEKFGRKLSGPDTEMAVDLLFIAMVDVLKAGERIEIRGFGAFSVHETKARLGRNPKTGESIAVPPRRAVKFKAGKGLLERIGKA